MLLKWALADGADGVDADGGDVFRSSPSLLFGGRFDSAIIAPFMTPHPLHSTPLTPSSVASPARLVSDRAHAVAVSEVRRKAGVATFCTPVELALS